MARSKAEQELMVRELIPKAAKFIGQPSRSAGAVLKLVNDMLWTQRQLRIRTKNVRSMVGIGTYYWLEEYLGTDAKGKAIWGII